jgi:CheY-like chemotaxis protein
MNSKILWVDDEIDLLKPHIMFLESKGYDVDVINNGTEALELCQLKRYDIVFLDENMPGLSGLDTLVRIKDKYTDLPVVMITKSEEETIMEDAIGRKIADYLIKPVHPNQLLLCLKKCLKGDSLVDEKNNEDYLKEFRNLGHQIDFCDSISEWISIYKKIVFWEIELKQKSLLESLEAQKKVANDLFCRFLVDNYTDWLKYSDKAPEMLHTLIKNRIAPKITNNKTFLLVIDNLRYDQWLILKPLISVDFNVDSEDIILSILPTTTHYARNALFSGLMPLDIQKMFPKFWVNEDEEGGRNNNEKELLEANLTRLGKSCKFSYNKITHIDAGKKLADSINQLFVNDFNVIVYNFVDMLSHARTEMEIIKELAGNEAAYRSLTASWFNHSPLKLILEKIAKAGWKLIITTDHGSVKVTNPVKIVGEKSTNSNLRYKVGRNLSYKEKDVYAVRDPKDLLLPKTAMSSEFVFCKQNDFFVYPNNYNQFVNYYGDTIQHGGISLEEILIPYIELSPKR